MDNRNEKMGAGRHEPARARQAKPAGDRAIDQLLAGDFLDVPQHFGARVMQQLEVRDAHSRGDQKNTRPGRLLTSLRWLGMIGGGALALSELLGFMFGLWSASHVF